MLEFTQSDLNTLKPLAPEMINLRYSEHEWLHTYANELLADTNNNAGAGTVCRLFAFYILLGPNTAHFDGEPETINTSLKQLFSHIQPFKSVVLSSSKEEIQSVCLLITHTF
jgi:hypothetical protein